MNRQHTKFRNSLEPEKVNKLTFIAMNEPKVRMMAEKVSGEKSMPNDAVLQDKDDQVLEEELLSIEQGEYERSCLANKLLDVQGFAAEEAPHSQILGKRPFALDE